MQKQVTTAAKTKLAAVQFCMQNAVQNLVQMTVQYTVRMSLQKNGTDAETGADTVRNIVQKSVQISLQRFVQRAEQRAEVEQKKAPMQTRVWIVCRGSCRSCAEIGNIGQCKKRQLISFFRLAKGIKIASA